MKKSVLLVAANQSVHPTLHYPVGFWASEIFHPIQVFNDMEINWQLCSPEGGKILMDPMSNPNDASGYSKWDTLSKGFVDNPKFMQLLEDSPSIESLDLDQFDALMVGGGQSPMFTFEAATDLQEAFMHFIETGKYAAALCHGVALLHFLPEINGDPFVMGKKITGFTNEEEDLANEAVKQEVMPWRIEDALKKKGAKFYKRDPWTPFAMVDGNLITGQQNMSGRITAETLGELLMQ
jgi:putative intracellular protease/amidase